MEDNIVLNKILKDLNIKEVETGLGIVYSISGPVVIGSNMKGVSMYELVKVGKNNLIGEVIKIESDFATIQVYEDTVGLELNDKIIRTFKPLCVELGPGLFENIYDGIQRSLLGIRKKSNDIFLPKGISIPSLDRKKEYNFCPTVKVGDLIEKSGIIGIVKENSLIVHKIMVSPLICGVIKKIVKKGVYTLENVVGEVEMNGKIELIKMYHTWPVRKPRPIKEKLVTNKQLFTGQRIIDSFFPMAQGGTAAIPGAFGCGKTVISQSISKYSNSDVVIYVGCGERGNEMSEVLMDFPKLKIGDTDECIMKRTILIANTSNMPVAAREASIYTGITIAEYFRDQGLNVCMMADSTSRWAEALREISGRLGEMPADNGYPAYLGARLSLFYERAGSTKNINNTNGSISIIGAVSPPGGDFSDPVTSATLSIVQVFWGLDKKLAQRKHFPSININISYSKYFDSVKLDEMFVKDIILLREILHYCNEITEIVQLVGRNNISEKEKLILDISRVISEDFLQQNGYSEYDRFCTIEKTILMVKNITLYYKMSLKLLRMLSWNEIKEKSLKVFYKLSQMKFIPVNINLKNDLNVITVEIIDCFKSLEEEI